MCLSFHLVVNPPSLPDHHKAPKATQVTELTKVPIPVHNDKQTAMDNSVWELYKPELHRLYIRENMSLSKVMEYMASKYGFEET